MPTRRRTVKLRSKAESSVTPPAGTDAGTPAASTTLRPVARNHIAPGGGQQAMLRSTLRFDETFNVRDEPAADETVVTALTPDWLNARSSTFRASGSAETTTGEMLAGSSDLTIATTRGWMVGQGVRIDGAGADGAPLTTLITAISGRRLILAESATTTVTNAVVSHDDTMAVQATLSAASDNDRTVFLPAGTYHVDELRLNSPNSLHIIGAGPGCTILRSRGDNPILEIDTGTTTAHSITIEGISFVGSAAASTPGAIQSNNYGLVFRDSGGRGIFNITIRNCRFSDCDNSAISMVAGANATFTVLLEGVDVSQPPDAVGDAIDIHGSNDLTLIRCYVHLVATGKAAYRVRSGAPVFIGCNGIDGGTQASWGVFGQSPDEDDAATYARALLIGCNIEDFTSHGIRCKAGSTASFFNTRLVAPASGAVTPIRFDFVGENQAGIFDGQSSIERKNSPSPYDDSGYANDCAIHSDGLPFVQIGQRGRTTFHDLSGQTSASLPGITGSRIAGSSHFALTHHGYSRFAGHLALTRQSSPVSPPAETGFLYARDENGATGLFWQADNLAEKRIDSAPATLPARQIGFGNPASVLAGSESLTFNEALGTLNLSREGRNPAILVSDTANSIDLRVGTLASAPDRGIIGTMSDDQFVLYQNGGEAWGLNSDKHWTPFAGDNILDVGTPNSRVRDGRFGGDLHIGGQIRSSGLPLTAAEGPGAGSSPTIEVSGTSLAGTISLTTGSRPAPGSQIADLALPTGAANLPVVIISPANGNAAALHGASQVFVDDQPAVSGSWRLTSGTTPLTPATVYKWHFHVILT